MDIKNIRNICNMSQRQFALSFGIPIGTVRNWEQGIAKPADYVYTMILASIRRDKMINLETIKFQNLMQELAALSQNGIAPFSEATEDNSHEKIFYDESSMDENGHCKVVLDRCIIDNPECYHHDIVNHYDDAATEYTLRAVVQEDEDPYLLVKFIISNEKITIDNGEWHFS